MTIGVVLHCECQHFLRLPTARKSLNALIQKLYSLGDLMEKWNITSHWNSRNSVPSHLFGLAVIVRIHWMEERKKNRKWEWEWEKETLLTTTWMIYYLFVFFFAIQSVLWLFLVTWAPVAYRPSFSSFHRLLITIRLFLQPYRKVVGYFCSPSIFYLDRFFFASVIMHTPVICSLACASHWINFVFGNVFSRSWGILCVCVFLCVAT